MLNLSSPELFASPSPSTLTPKIYPSTRGFTIHTDLKKAVRTIGYPDFKSTWQAEGCQLVHEATDNILLVGPTSAGKSLFWNLPVAGKLERGRPTVVIAPLRALLGWGRNHSWVRMRVS